MLSNFELLPRELRDQIYEYCLCVEGDIVPFPALYEGQCNLPYGVDPSDKWFQSESKARPSIALLLVNKRVGNEAAEVLYGKNTWRMSHSGLITENDLWEIKPSHTDFWQNHAPLFRHINIQFRMSDYSSPRVSMSITQKVEGSAPACRFNDDEIKQAIHHERLKVSMGFYNYELISVNKMDLETLTFGVSNFYCPSGCCRREALEKLTSSIAEYPTDSDRSVWYLLKDNGWSFLQDDETIKRKQRTKVRIEGLRNTNEKELFRSGWGLEIE